MKDILMVKTIDERFIDSINEALGRIYGQTVEEIKNELRNEGVDVEETLNRLKKMSQDISMKSEKGS
jgi:hypothetical protein